MKTLSIIIPCYNGWEHMQRCFEALENQTCLPDEIIIIDDCSTDDSYERLCDYKSKSALNIVVKKNIENCGPGKTRENAISIATGDYIAFCDCDDWYEIDFVKEVQNIINAEEPDMIIYDNYKTYDNRKAISHTTTPLVSSSKKEIMALYKTSLWRLTTKKKCFENVIYPSTYNAEDAAVVPQIMLNSNTIRILDLPLYNYYFREGSASTKPSENAYKGFLAAFDIVNSIANSKYPIECEFLCVKLVCYGATLNAFKTGISKREIKNFILSFEALYPRWFNNPYIKTLNKIKSIYLFFIKRHLFFVAGFMTRLHHTYTKYKGV